MPFTVEDLQDLLRLLEQHPEWKGVLRASLLGEELLRVPEILRELAEKVRQLAEAQRQTEEAQRRTEERVGRLEVALAELTEEVRKLAEAQRRTEERVGRLEAALTELVEAQRRTDERVARLEVAVTELAEAQRRTEETVRALAARVGDLEGDNLERRYRERAASYFQDVLRRIRVVDHQRLGLLLDDALDAGRISREERAEVLRADVVLEGVVDGQEVYLLAEVSATVTAHDVRRALRRAVLLEKALGRPVLAAVAGRQLSTDRETLEEAERVWRVVDGKTESPSV